MGEFVADARLSLLEQQRALMEGEPTVVHQFTARNAIIAGGVKEE
jgi:hypothetical protein